MSPALAEPSGRGPCRRKSPVPAFSIVDLAIRSCTLGSCRKGISIASSGGMLSRACRSSSAFDLAARGGQYRGPVSVSVSLSRLRRMASGSGWESLT